MMSGRLLTVMLIVLLTACGGGGGGGNSGGGGGQSGKYSISLSKSSVELSAAYEQWEYATQDIDVTYKGDGVIVGTLPGAILPPWLSISDGVPTGSGKARFSLSANAYGLALGTHRTTLRFLTGSEDGENIVYKDLSVALTVQDKISVDREEIYLNQLIPAENFADTSIEVSSIGQQLGWSIESNVDWLSFSPASGTGSSIVNVAVDSNALPAGTYTAEVTVVADNQTEASVSVTLNIEARHVYAQRQAVALAATANTSRLTGSITMVDPASFSAPDWQVEPSDDWLSIDSIDGNIISISADPSELEDGIHFAEVNVSSTIEGIASTEKINVGLFKSSDASAEGKLLQINDRNDYYGAGVVTAVDPLRPYLYILDETGTIRRVNVHTGAVDSPFPVVEGYSFSGMTVSSNGETLYAHTTEGQIYMLDLFENTWTYFSYPANFGNPSRITEIHPNGKPLLVIQDGYSIVDPQTAQVLAEKNDFQPLFYYGALEASGDQLTLFGADLGLSGSALHRWSLSYSHNKNELVVWRTHSSEYGISYGNDFAVNAAGDLIYATGSSYDLFEFDTLFGITRLSDGPGTTDRSNVEIADNNILYGGTNAYDLAGELLQSYSIDSMSLLMSGKGLKISGDGTRVLMIATGYQYGDETSLWSFPAVE